MKVLLFLCLLIPIINCFSQEKFSKEVLDVSENIVKQITGNSAKAKLGKDTANFKVAIVSIENEDRINTKLTELLENKIAINLAMKSEGRYDILDRNYIEQLMKEKNIPLAYDNKRDFAKNLGKIKAANFIIVGTLSNFENDFELNLQVIETVQGNTIGGATGNITATELLKAKNEQTNASPSKITPINTPVPIIAPKVVVEAPKFGDFCFSNKGTFPNYNVKVSIYKVKSEEIEKVINVSNGEKTCAYELPVGIHKVELVWLQNSNDLKTEYKEIKVTSEKTGNVEYIFSF